MLSAIVLSLRKDAIASMLSNRCTFFIEFCKNSMGFLVILH